MATRYMADAYCPKESHTKYELNMTYVSVNSKPDHPRVTPEDSHILVAPWVGFSLLCFGQGSAQGRALNQSKSSIILKKGRFSLCLSNKRVATL